MCRILVDSFADKGLTNAQMSNAREIVRRLDPERFQVTMFHVGTPDEEIASRPHTRLARLPKGRQTPWILNEFLTGPHDIVFYVKSSPATKWYFKLTKRLRQRRITIGTVESRSNLRRQPAIPPEAVSLWEQTILRSDKLISNSCAVRASLEVEYGLDSDIVPTGVDTKFFFPAPERALNPRPRVLFVGSLRPFKQPEILLQAAARFPAADFVIVGDGPLSGLLRERTVRERLGNVQLMGTLAGQSLRREYQSADIFLFPSTWEGSPKVILEAAASGLPVIARKTYEPETVVEGCTGFLVGSDDELFSRLSLLIASPELRQRLGTTGRMHSTKFDWDGITRQWETVFLTVWNQQRSMRAS